METKLVEIPIKSVVIFLFFLSNLNLILSSLDGRTVNLILSPLNKPWGSEVVTIPA